jgi:rubrerythrin
VTGGIRAHRLGRRQLLRDSGLVVSLGALVAACGENRSGGTDPGRVGNAPGVDPLPDVTVDDVVLLRTAQSLEHTALDVYGRLRELDVLSPAQDTVFQRLVDDHTGHSVAVGGWITDAGGEEFACANPWLADRAIEPILEALDETDDALRDVLNIAHAIENLAASSYQSLVGSITDPELRMMMMQVGADENRHAAVLAMEITGTPDGYVDPALIGGTAPAEDSEFPAAYAVPSVFGSVAATELVVGSPDAEGRRLTINLQTPAANSFVYPDLSC